MTARMTHSNYSTRTSRPRLAAGMAATAAAVLAVVGLAPNAASAPAPAPASVDGIDLGSIEQLGIDTGSVDTGSLDDVLGSIGGSMNQLPDGFDLQAHRGGMGLHTESSPYSFGNALSLGVTTLELDTQVTKDGQVVVTHDRKTNPQVCQDTAPATPGDPDFPYMGKYIHELTLAQVRTLDCGSIAKPDYPQQQTHPGSKMMLLSEVFDLVRERGANQVRFNIETKVEAGAPEETAPRDVFVPAVLDVIHSSGMAGRVEIQSFDWGALRLAHQIDPSLPLVALTNGDFLQVGQPGVSPWTGGVDVDDFGGDGVAAAASIPGVVAYSPVDTRPQTCDVSRADCEPYTTPEIVQRAHELGLKIIPWTVDHKPTMEYLLDAGVDGIITNYPDVLRELLVSRGIEVADPVA